VKFSKEKNMRDQLEKIIANLQGILDELDKVEAGSYGYKSAAPRARKALMEASKELRDVRTIVQEVKNSHEQK
tara:strand:- start:1224 stop:1442 length:219 start_codon:yes stop_codon:yes gene_type:complete